MEARALFGGGNGCPFVMVHTSMDWGVEAEEMMYFEWIMAALGVIVVYMLLGYAWVWWTAREWMPKK